MSQSPRADLWFSIALTLFGAAIAFESWRMPRLDNLGIDPASAPGVTPGLLGGVLVILGVLLFVRSFGAAPRPAEGGGWGRLALALSLCLIYAVALVGRLPFSIATALFVAAFALLFSLPSERPIRAVATAAVLAVATSAAVTLLFERVFLVRLP